MLGTLDDLKGKLDIPESDTSRDGPLTLALETATAKVLHLCRYAEEDEASHVETFRNVTFNRDLLLELRPIDPDTIVFEGRALGEATWSTLDGDVLNADEGRVILLGASAWWPPTNTLQPGFTKWRDPVWPLIRVTYDVTGLGNNPASELIDAAASLAGFWYDRDLAGAGESSMIGPVSRKWLNESLPKTLLEKLTGHMSGRGGGAQWV